MASETATAKRKVIRKVQRLSSIPDLSIYESYISRKISPVIDDMQLFDFAYENNKNVLIEGPTGSGKTMAVQAWAARTGLHFYSISSNIGIEPSQLFGKYIPDGNGGIHWQDGPVTDIVRHGGVLLINEVNFVPERVSTVLFSLLDKRREIQLVDHQGEVITAHDQTIVFADMNPDYEGTRPLNKAFRNRFAVQLNFDYDYAIEGNLVGVPALIDLARKFRDAQKNGEYSTPVSTNMLIEFKETYQFIGLEFAITNFINHFTDDERSSVKLVVDNMKANIQNGLKSVKRLTPYGHDYFDKDRGEYGVDWVYEDDEVDEEGSEADGTDNTVYEEEAAE